MIGHTFGSGDDGHRGLRGPQHEKPHATGDERSHKRDAFASVLSTGALGSSAGVLISRIDALCRDGRRDDAVRKLRKSLAEQPPLAAGLIAALDAAGRPADVAWVIREASALDTECCGQIVVALWRAGLTSHLPPLIAFAKADRLFEITAWAVASAPAPDASGAVHLLVSATLTRPAGELVACAFRWRDAGKERDADTLFRVLARTRPPALLAAAEDLIARDRVPECEELLAGYARRAAPSDAISLFAGLLGSLPEFLERTAAVLADRADSHEVLRALDETLPAELAELCLGEIISSLTSERLVRLCGQLHRHELTDVLELVLVRCVGQVDAAELVKALHAASLHYAAYRLAELAGQFDDINLTARDLSG